MSETIRITGEASPDPVAAVQVQPEQVAAKAPFYPQLLRLKNIHPNAWQRAFLGEGMALFGVLLSMADLASAWSILVLPVAVGVIVKGHDVLAGVLRTTKAPDP